MILSTFRRNERDVIDLYDSFSKIMQILTEGYMLNFGYWDKNTKNPLDAQNTLTNIVGRFSSLDMAKTLIDIGSGYSAPALQWNSKYKLSKIICINLNLEQLKTASRIAKLHGQNTTTDIEKASTNHQNKNIFYLNATSTALPIRKEYAERIIAFESAQHFKPFKQFIQESHRVLNHSGYLILAMPVIINNSNYFSIPQVMKIGILSITWASEHYNIKYIENEIKAGGFQIEDIQYIGPKVYVPLANYYIKNREELKSRIIKEYPKFLETILYKSLLKMKSVSENNMIEYILLKAKK